MALDQTGSNQVLRNVHTGPEATGDNIDAFRVASYAWDGANWQRVSFVNNNPSGTFYSGQQTVNTTQVQVTSTPHTLSNGMRIKAPSANLATIYVGATGVTTSTGDALEPGESVVWPVNNTNILYIISVASTTDTITWSAL